MSAASARKETKEWSPFDDRATAPFELPALPYAKDALEPTVSAETLGFHYGKHHKTYVDKTNEMAKSAGMQDKTLIEIIKASAGKDDKDSKALFNNAAQTWNHTFYWHSMTPKGGGRPAGNLAAAIDKDLGGFDKFVEAFADAATKQFGSGWAWLVVDGGKLKVMATGNAETPIAKGKTPLITLDVWEHAYYLDYQNRRPDYVKAWLENVVDWSFAAENFNHARRK